MAGWRVGAVVGNRDVIAASNILQEHYYVSLPPLIQRAAVAALTGPQGPRRRADGGLRTTS
ncbi:aminotransferase class I/II-fold pyridoxal phosphate-dependent enzyme [Streptomyces ossamyceticus]|nr:aminotransferase class I/II-fold pyridoxal phosphate-dependent enzyme [Streptomyces ossamyceticus]